MKDMTDSKDRGKIAAAAAALAYPMRPIIRYYGEMLRMRREFLELTDGLRSDLPEEEKEARLNNYLQTWLGLNTNANTNANCHERYRPRKGLLGAASATLEIAAAVMTIWAASVFFSKKM